MTTKDERAELIRELREWGATVVNAGQHHTAQLCSRAAALLASPEQEGFKPLDPPRYNYVDVESISKE